MKILPWFRQITSCSKPIDFKECR